MNKKSLGEKGNHDSAAVGIDDQSDMSSDDEVHQESQMNLLNTSNQSGGVERKKARIPWDRNPLGDKNGLKLGLLTVVHDSNFHVNGGLMENFREVSRILSQDGSKFEKYDGIEPSGAQRKFNSVIREIATHFPVKENGEFENEENAEGFQIVGLKLLRDIINKEKVKLRSYIQKANDNTNNMMVGGNEEPNVIDEDDMHTQEPASVPTVPSISSTSFLKKRKAEITPLKHQLKRIAGSLANPNPSDMSMLSDKGGDLDDDMQDTGINRLDTETHARVVHELEKLGITNVGELLKAADVSANGIHNFVNKTQVKLTKPVDRMLKLYEEVAVAKDFVSKMGNLCGLHPGDALEFESYVKPFYTQTHHMQTHQTHMHIHNNASVENA
jgi:hypothetical protein